MTIRYFTIILLLLIPLQAEIPTKGPKYKPGLVGVGLDIKKLGENLWILTTDANQQSGWNKQSCSIGYKEPKDGGYDYIPAIQLPDLENDSYAITLVDGVIHVRSAKNKTEFIAVDTALLRKSSKGIKSNFKRITFRDVKEK